MKYITAIAHRAPAVSMACNAGSSKALLLSRGIVIAPFSGLNYRVANYEPATIHCPRYKNKSPIFILGVQLNRELGNLKVEPRILTHRIIRRHIEAHHIHK